MKLREIEIKAHKERKIENILNYDFEYNLNCNRLLIKYNKKEDGLYPEIENIFSEIDYDLENDKVTNLDEILKKWEKVYTKFLLCNNSELNDIAVELNKYYRVKENIEFILNNSSFFPYLKLMLNLKEIFKEKFFYNLLDFEEIQFNISKKIDIYKDIKTIQIEGVIPSTFNFIALKKEVRETLGITPDKLFEMNITLFGKVIYKEDMLKEGELEIKLSTNDYIEKIYRLEIKE
ncbi:MAG: hypothetical protein RR523_00795 [Cetobacterium sp.]|uniref:hypothetical protein n=1 Tax=Cetobacterium sp. TaxID=2071632 RepID=UPI002FC6373E